MSCALHDNGPAGKTREQHPPVHLTDILESVATRAGRPALICRSERIDHGELALRHNVWAQIGS